MPPPYTPLNADKDEIRILTLLPGQSSDPIDCTLQVASLDDAPKYEALSYVWGDAVVQREVFVDGHPTNVTVSLETALRALRNEDKPRALWADAICMNQSDILEKNFQVPLMGRVYAEADSVLVWLGEPSPEVELVITCLSRPGVDQPELLSGLLSEMSFDDLVMFWEGLNQMITHKYWTRMWTYQEFRLAKAEPIIVLGRSVLYPSQLESGSKEVMDALESALDTSDQKYDRARFGKACRRLRWLFERSKTFAMVKNPLEQCTLNNQSPETLSQLLIDTCVRRSEDPRDHIYALYGLLPKVRQALPPDYGRLPRHIMHDSTMYVINENSAAFGALLRIYCLQGDRLSDCSVPSWVLNFASTLPIWDSPYAPPETIHHLSPSVGLTEQVAEDNSLEISDDGKLLFIRARSLGRCNVHFRFSDDLSEVASQVRSIPSMAQARSTRDQRANIDRRLTTMLLAHEGTQSQNLVEKITRDDLETLHVKQDDGSDEQHEVRRCLRRLPGKTVFSTPACTMGITVAAVQDGDVVVTSGAVSSPMILRLEEGERRSAFGREQIQAYRLVSPAYVDGIMDNDCMDGATIEEIRKKRLEDFIIR